MLTPKTEVAERRAKRKSLGCILKKEVGFLSLGWVSVTGGDEVELKRKLADGTND